MKKTFLIILLILLIQNIYSESTFILQSPFRSNYYVSRTFGFYEDSSKNGFILHEGIDFVIRTGSPVYPACDGIITEISYNTDLGNFITILHSNGFKTLYCNLQSFRCKIGESVSTNDIIATSGNTGTSLEPHLCFRLYDLYDVAINPTEYFKELPDPTTPPDKEIANSSFHD